MLSKPILTRHRHFHLEPGSLLLPLGKSELTLDLYPTLPAQIPAQINPVGSADVTRNYPHSIVGYTIALIAR